MRHIKTTSENHEDEFAHILLTKGNPSFKGTFLDIGCGHGRHGSNTYTLEEAGWTGWMLDTNKDLMMFNSKFRKCKTFYLDNYNINWTDVIPSMVDYISCRDSAAVRTFPWNTIRFRVLTINHGEYKEEFRRVMAENKYVLLASDVCNDFSYQPFADWFVDPNTVDADIVRNYMNKSVRGIEVVYKPKSEGRYLSFSADLQDEFTARILGTEGRFLDVGCGHGFDGNNTLALEKLGWDGVMIDFNKENYEWNKIHRSATAFNAKI
jgi:SAM-dependent methyltransferase